MPRSDDSTFAPLMLGPHALPTLWRHFLPAEAQWLTLPREGLASCDDCYWARLGKCRDDCRCCTHFPQLPNFQLGLALRDPSCRETALAAIDGHMALPQGLLANPRLFRMAVASQAEDRFGEDPAQRCPFLRGSDYRCGIHAFRNSVCATFFCEHDHGDDGAELWAALQSVVGHVETVLAQWAMEQVGFSSIDYFRRVDGLGPEIGALSLGDAWAPAAREILWGSWFGREVAFFEGCADAILRDKERLYEIACAQEVLEARDYERALLKWLPETLRGYAPPASTGKHLAIPERWYRLQLKVRQLWQLPFGEGTVELAAGLSVVENPRDDVFSRAHPEPLLLRDQQQQCLLFCDRRQAAVLELFRRPQTLGEQLLERDELSALDDAKAQLAQWMRRGILVES